MPSRRRRRQASCDAKPAATRTQLRALFESTEKFPAYLLENPLQVYSIDLALFSNYFVKVVYPGRIRTFPVHVCLIFLWKTVLGMFNCLSYELSYKLFPSVAAAGILYLACRTADIGLLSVIDGIDCSQYIDDYRM